MLDGLKQVFSEFSKDRCTTLAAALAYYTIFALPPLLFLLVMVLSLSMTAVAEGDQAQQRAESIVQQQMAQLLGNESAADEIGKILENQQESGGKWWKALIGLVGIIAGATGVVAALQDSLNRVWNVQVDPEHSGILNTIKKRVLSFGMILGLGFLLLVSFMVSTVLNAAGQMVGETLGISDLAAQITNYAVQSLVTFVIFSAIFKFMPDAVIRWRDCFVGAAATTVLFLLGRLGLQYYLSMSDPGAQLGSAAASLAALLVWVYYSGVIFLLGAEIAQVYAARCGEGIQPEAHAVRVTQQLGDKPGGGRAPA